MLLGTIWWIGRTCVSFTLARPPVDVAAFLKAFFRIGAFFFLVLGDLELASVPFHPVVDVAAFLRALFTIGRFLLV